MTPESSRFAMLVEAIADGHPVDLAEAEGSASTPEERAALSVLRDLAAIGAAYATLSVGVRGEPRLRPVLKSGTAWGALKLVEHVGRGRFGEVYRAWDPALDRHVALKLVRTKPSADTAETHIVDEGRLMARVRHPNVVAVHGAQRIGDTDGIWMEFVEGQTLTAELAERGCLPAGEVISVGRQMADALAAIHEAGLVHRDVKAANVIRDPTGRVVLGDFGTGFELDDDGVAGEGLVGTPAYLAPEIFTGGAATPRSDVYSLGVLLFHLATSAYPHGAGSLSELRTVHGGGDSRPSQMQRTDLPAALTAVINRALDPDPAARFASGREMADALAALPRSNRRRLAWTAAAIAATVIGAWALWSLMVRPFEFREADWVLVAAFDNRTGNAAFEGAIEYALEAELAGSQFLNVAPRERVNDALALMRRPPVSRVSAADAREVALRDGGIRAFLTGQLTRVGGSYQVTAQVFDPRDDRVVLSVPETASSEGEVLPAVKRLAGRIRSGLGEVFAQASSQEPPLPRVTTRSLMALQLFDRASADLNAYANPQAAERLLTEAVALDPEFAVAHIALARAIREQFAGASLGRREEIAQRIDRAIGLSALLGLSDRYRVLGEAERLRADLVIGPPPPVPVEELSRLRAERRRHREAAAEAIEVLRRLEPDDPWPLRSLLRLYLDLNRPPAAAVPLARALAAMLPNSIEALHRAADRCVAADEIELAQQYLSQAKPLLETATASDNESRSFGIRYLLVDDAWARNDIDAAAGYAAKMAQQMNAVSVQAAGLFAENLVWIHIALGQFDAAEAVAGRIRNEDLRSLRKGSAVLRRGVVREMQAFLDSTPRDSMSWSNLAPTHIRAGRLGDARIAIESTRKNGASREFMMALDADLAIGEGQPARAIEILQPLASSDWIAPNGVWLTAYSHLAEAHAAAGNPREAIATLERMFQRPRRLGWPGVPAADGWMRARDRLASLYRADGQAAKADAIERELRLLLRHADDDHPILRRIGR